MAILSNLVVNGSSRFLNHVYMNDLSVAGTTSLSSLSLSGNLSVAGTTTLTGRVTVGGYNNTNYGLSANSIIVNNWIRTVGSTGWYNESHGGGWYMSDNNYIRSYGKPVMMGHNLYFGNNSRYINTSGDAVLNSINNATDITTNNLNVANNLHATHFDLQTVAQLGGSFYVSPTVKFPNSGTTLGVAKSGTTLTLTITDSSITSTTMAGIVWSANSRVKVSGTINGVVTGTMDGTVSSINTSSHVLTLSVSGENSGSVVAGTYSASQFSDLSVMVYQRRVVDGSTNNDYRVGIWMNCYDIANSSATIRVYGGTSSAPNVLLGNLTNAGLGTVNGITPSGWGLYAQNAFLWGAIVSTEGQIGGWTIGEDKLYNGTDSLTSTTPGTYIGAGATAATSGIRNYKDANTFVNITGGVITAKAVDLTGKITATSGKIGKYNITTSYLDTYQDPSNPTAATNAGFGGNQAFWAGNNSSDSAPFRVSYGGALVATSATITGAITATSGTIGASNATNKITIGTNTTNASIYYGMSSLSDTTNNGFYIGTDGIALGKGAFKVTNAGVLSATGASISGTLTAGANSKIGPWTVTATSIYKTNATMGNATAGAAYFGDNGLSITDKFQVTAAGAITATSGTIGGISLDNNYGLYTNSKTAANSSKDGFLISKDGAIYLGAYNTTNGTCPFQVTSAGKLTAISGKIGGWTLSRFGLSYAGATPDSTSVTLIPGGTSASSNSIGGSSGSKSWIFTAKNVFGIDNTGKMFCNGGQIAGWTIGAKQLYNGTLAADNSMYLATENIGSNTTIAGRSGSDWRFTVGSNFGVTNTGAAYANSGVIGGWELSSDKFSGNSYSIMQNETGTVKNTTYLYSGTTSSEDITKQDSSNTYIIKPGTNASICVDFSTRPVHENRLGYYSNNLYINIGVKITGFVGNATIKYTYEYRDYDNKTISVTTAKHVNITETTTIYQPISIVPYGEVLLNADVQVVYETPYTINGSGGNISTLCSIRSSENTSTIFFYAKPINAYYLDSFSAMSIQRIYNNDTSTQEETYRLEQSGYIYSKGGLRTSGDIVFNDNISMIELSKRNAVQSATKTAAVSSSNTIDGTPAVGAQLTLDPGTYLICGRFVFGTASTTGTRNNQVAIYRGASPTNSTVVNHSITRVMAAANNWASLTTSTIVTHTSSTTYTVGGTSSRPENGSGGESAIYAVRLL